MSLFTIFKRPQRADLQAQALTDAIATRDFAPISTVLRDLALAGGAPARQALRASLPAIIKTYGAVVDNAGYLGWSSGDKTL